MLAGDALERQHRARRQAAGDEALPERVEQLGVQRAVHTAEERSCGDPVSRPRAKERSDQTDLRPCNDEIIDGMLWRPSQPPRRAQATHASTASPAPSDDVIAPLVVVMGVSGSGKSTVGAALAQRLGVPYADADDFHPDANIAKMSAGQALDDTDRRPWLDAVGRWLAEHDGSGGVMSCSALKVAYRDQLRRHASRVELVHLHGTREVIARRQASRPGHFMPASLLDSQFATLEPLGADEPGQVVSVDQSVDAIVQAYVDQHPRPRAGPDEPVAHPPRPRRRRGPAGRARRLRPELTWPKYGRIGYATRNQHSDAHVLPGARLADGPSRCAREPRLDLWGRRPEHPRAAAVPRPREGHRRAGDQHARGMDRAGGR